MIELYNANLVKAIGVSNFQISDIEALIAATGIKPMVNQIRFFIGNTQEELTQYCQKNGILVEAYSPLATGELTDNPKVKAIAEKYHTSLAKICLRYCLQRNTLPLPKSVHRQRIKENIEIDFELQEEDMNYLDSLYHIASTRPFRS